jgi:hypothetical protein
VSTLNSRQAAYSDRRRSQRVLLSVAVGISGTNAGGTAFSEETTTAVVSAHGGLVLLKEAVRQGQRLKVRNLNTSEETECITVDANAGSNEPHEVGIEFVAAAPRFWRIAFPPTDWTARSPEAKRFEKDSTVQPTPAITAKK